MRENHFPDASPQASQAQGVFQRPLEAPKPHILGRTSVFRTIELIAETSHNARLHFLFMVFETSFVEGFAGMNQFLSHRDLADAEHPWVVNKNKMIGARGSFLSVSSGKDGK